MTPDDAITLLRQIAAYSPGMTITDHTPPAWWELLGDLTLNDALAAVRAHYAASHSWITPADIRRHVADRIGVLPPDPDTAFAQARRWSTWRGPAGQPWPTTDEPQIHPAARDAARTLGWTWLDETPDGIARARWRETYASAADAVTRRALAPGGIGAVLGELAAGLRPALPPAPAEKPLAEVDHSEVMKLRALISGIATAKTPPAPRADYDPPTELECARQAAELRRWAAERGQPIEETG